MITPEEFPYIKSLYVNDCYAYKDFNIELYDYKPFSHLILTGKNGSGKSTILKAIHRKFFPDNNPPQIGLTGYSSTRTEDGVKINKSTVLGGQAVESIMISFSILHKIKVENSVDRLMKPDEILKYYSYCVYSYFEAKRGYSNQDIQGPSNDEDFTIALRRADSTKYFINSFKQYLVNKKIDQAFAQIEGQFDHVEKIDNFFYVLRSAFSNIFDQKIEAIDFQRNRYEFYLRLVDGRRLTFNMLPEGISALLSVLMDLFMRVDLIRKQVSDYSYNPCGIVLIDEPETHLHLQLQEQVLPLLTSLFPNIQFIAATHSPAVVASIKNATIFDLTTKESRGSEETVGRSYSDLMMSHFGLENEYSETADAIIKQVNDVLNQLADKPTEMKAALQKIYDENSDYLSPTLKVELELLIAQKEAHQIAHQ